MIFLEYLPSIIANLNFEKQNWILRKIKKPLPNPAMLTEIQDMTPEKMEGPETTQIIDLKLAPDGTVRTYTSRGGQPMRLYPDNQTLIITAIYKRLLFEILSSFEKQNPLKKIITLLAIKWNTGVMEKWFANIFETNQVLLKEQHYSQPVKEIRRVLGKGYITDAITLILENDSAYRYRLQDILAELDKTKLKGYRSTVKELQRLVGLLAERDIVGTQSTKWGKLKKVIPIILLHPKIRKKVVDTLKEINIDEVKLSVEDIWWTNEYSVYNCRGIDWETRKKENNSGK